MLIFVIVKVSLSDSLLSMLNFRSSVVCFMATLSWSACVCPSSGPKQTSPSLQDQWFWPCLIQSYQVFTRQTLHALVCASPYLFYLHESTVLLDRNGGFNRVMTSTRLFGSHGAPSSALCMRLLQESCFFCCVSLPSCIAGSTSSLSCCSLLTGCFIRCVVWLAACQRSYDRL